MTPRAGSTARTEEANESVKKQFQIIGTGVCLPDKVLTNADLEKVVDTNDAWITERTGIRERRIADDATSTSDLVARAVANACADANIEPSELDTLIVATSTTDTLFPSTACWVQDRLGLRGPAAFDVSAGCTGWLYALEVGASLIAAGTARRVCVAAGEVMSKVLDWDDRRTCVLFGDGAAATVLSPPAESRAGGEDAPGLLASNWGADGTLANILYQPAGGTQMPASAESVEKKLHTVHMQGAAVFKHAVTSMARSARQVLADANMTAEDIDLLVTHQANIRIIDATRERLGVPAEKAYNTVDRYGNVSAATIPIALHEARMEGKISDGDRLVLTSFGTGLTWASVALRW